MKRSRCLLWISMLTLGGCATGLHTDGAPGALPIGARITLDAPARSLGDVSCDFYKASNDQNLEQFEIRCAGWERYTGLVWRGDKPPTAQDWEKTFLENSDLAGTVQRDAACAAPESTRILKDQPATVRRCTTFNGGFPYLLLAASTGNRVFVLWGPAHLAPLFEGFIATSLRGTAHAQQPGSRSALIALAERSIATDGRALGLEDMGQFSALDELSGLYNSAKNHQRALELAQRALEIHERIRGVNDPGGGYLVSRIGRELSTLQPGAAEAMFRRAEPLVKASSNAADWPELLVYRTWHELSRGRRAQAEQSAQKSWEAIRAASGRAPNRVAHSLIGLGDAYVALDRLEDASKSYAEALEIFQRVRGNDYHWIGESQQRLAEVARRRGDLSAARTHAQAATEMRRTLFGGGRALAEALMTQARIERADHQPERALTLWRAAKTMLLTHRSARAELQLSDLEDYLSLLFEQANATHDQMLLAEAFVISQLGQTPAAGQAVTQAAARMAEKDPAVRTAARALQDALKVRQDTQYALGVEQSKPANARNADREAALKEQLRAATAHYQQQEQQLQAQFPRYGQLITPSPLSVGEIAKLLHRQEALLRILPGERETWVFLIKPDGALHSAAVPLTAKQLADQVGQLRTGVDANSAGGGIPDFDTALAHTLYRTLLGPIDPALTGVGHLIVVPSGALLSLPPALLVRRAPTQPHDYAHTAWLVRDMGLSILPSVIALQQLRQLAGASHAKSPFVGFGNPVLLKSANKPATSSEQIATQACVPDAEAVNQLVALPETADELRALGNTLGANPGQDVHLGQQATVTAVQATALQNYRIIAFATHALLPGELSCLSEPALVMTPGGSGTSRDNGLLRASAITSLKLDADWVLLSACNTAGSGGDRLRGEGLSGLATAFFYAGTRALLASHWSVVSKPTVFLTTHTFDTFRKTPALGRAEALRRSQLALLNDPTTAHPMFWAAFTLIGADTSL